MSSTRRNIMSALLGTALCSSALGQSAWQAYQSVEEAWIRDRYALLVSQFPGCQEAAAIDLDLKLADLQRRAMQFRYLSKRNSGQLRGGVWQFSWLPMQDSDLEKIASSSDYRLQEKRIRRLTEELRKHPQSEEFRRAQAHLWKTPEYHSIHRRYSAHIKELNREYR